MTLTPTVAACLASSALAVSVLAGCSLGGDPVQRQWEGRDPLPSCGEVRVAQTERLEDVVRPEVACLEAALASGASGEMVLFFTTTEGDPITEYLRVTPAGTEVYTDATKDTFGSGRWSYGSCTRPTSAMDSAC